MREVPPAEKKQKCVIYVRVSSAKQVAEGTGLSSQERSCRNYAEARGYHVVEVFSDIVSGTVGKRAGTKALVRYLKVQKAENLVVVVDDIDRFARDVVVYGELNKQIASLAGR